MSASNNVTDKTRLEVVQQVREIQRKQRQLSGQLTQVKQKAKAMGINVKGMLRALTARDQDPDELIEEEREFIRFSALFNLPTKQVDLFPDGERVADPKVDQDVATFEAYDAGYLAGGAGRSIDDNPYSGSPGSETFVQWRKGWDAGQASIAYRADGGETQGSTERRPRGNKRKASAEEVGNDDAG